MAITNEKDRKASRDERGKDMIVKVPVFIALAMIIPFLPGRIMKLRKKCDLVGDRKRTLITVISESVFLVSNLFLLLREDDLVNFVLLSSILMLSAVVVIVDTRCRIIPNLCLFPMLLIAAGYLVYNMLRGAEWVNIPYSIISMLMMCFGLITLTNVLRFRGYLGAGDIKYCAVAAFLFTFSQRIVGMLIFTVLSMVLYLIPMFLAKKITMKSLIAFGPFIGFGVMGGICWQYLPASVFMG